MIKNILSKFVFFIGFLVILTVNVFSESYRPVPSNLQPIKGSIVAPSIEVDLQDRYTQYDYTIKSKEATDPQNRIPSSNSKKDFKEKKKLEEWSYEAH